MKLALPIPLDALCGESGAFAAEINTSPARRGPEPRPARLETGLSWTTAARTRFIAPHGCRRSVVT